MQILQNKLRAAARKRRAAELSNASPAEKENILQEIEKEVAKAIGQQARKSEPETIIH